jgi:hypothetical protein
MMAISRHVSVHFGDPTRQRKSQEGMAGMFRRIFWRIVWQCTIVCVRTWLVD